mgnify:CR=1 FL=1
MANIRADGQPCWWTTAEDRTLRHVYPREGVDAAVLALPGRTRRAVCQRAQTLGLSAPRTSRAGLPRVRWPATPEIDAALQREAPACATVAQLRALADRLQRPLPWLRRRCAELGVAAISQPVREWTRAELRLLEQHAHLPAIEISRAMRRAGHRRSAGAVALRLRRIGMDRSDPDSHTTTDISALLGVSSATVSEWIRQHGLRASRRQPDDPAADGKHYRVHRKDLRAWLRDHPSRVDLAKVDKTWFLDLALGSPQ